MGKKLITFFLFPLLGISLFIGSFFAESASAVAVRAMPLYPLTNSNIDGKVTFRATVEGMPADQYTMSWTVNNDKPNAMQRDLNNPYVWTAKVTVTNWTWQANNTYNLRFIAKVTATGQTITSSVVPIHITSKLTQPQPPVAELYTYPYSNFARQATAWSLTHPLDAPKMNFLAAQPVGIWFGGWNTALQADVSSYVARATLANKIPLLVAYNIPERDCGHHSAGGVESFNAYAEWIQQMANGIGNSRAMVVLEPDALTTIGCLIPEDQTGRLAALSNAVHILKQNPMTQVYIDAGNARWKPVNEIAPLLAAANIAEADGFSLNVSNFVATNDNIAYGKSLSTAVGNKHFVIDTSRNGNGTTNDNQWCNPAGMALGVTPSLRTADPLVDGYLWVKVPGESDGFCGTTINGTSAPKAGAWWPEYALSIASNAGY